jgi:oxygen-independent coproporphyrinogen-3 oxidase
MTAGDRSGATVRAGRPAPPRGMYVHIPFCVSLCPYCDFVVYAGAAAVGPSSRIEAFLTALHHELDLRADGLDVIFGRVEGGEHSGRPRLETLYLGGGTPSLLAADQLAAIIDHVRHRFGLVEEAEVSLEANPGPDERGDPAAQRAAGVTRLSLGAQSLDAAELHSLGRRHSPADVADAVVAARAAGMESIGLDLLYDVPGQSLDSWFETLEGALELAPDHLSLYALSLDDPGSEGLTGPAGDHLPTTAGARRWRSRARPRQDEDRAAAMYHHATVRLAESGFDIEEISNWSRPRHEARHNRLYWSRQPVEGVGPGAHAFDGLDRRWNAARLEGYLGALAPSDGSAPMLPTGGREELTAADAASERVILGLRMTEGVPVAAAFEPPLLDVFGWALSAELLEVAGGSGDERVRLTVRGRLLSNELFARLV